MASPDSKALIAGGAAGAILAFLVGKVGTAEAADLDLDELVAALDALTEALQIEQIYDNAFDNYGAFATGQVICTVANRGFELPSMPIPRNKVLVVKALPTNGGWIWVGAQQAQSQDITVSYPLLANEGIGLAVTNANLVWVMGPVLNDGVAFIVEQG